MKEHCYPKQYRSNLSWWHLQTRDKWNVKTEVSDRQSNLDGRKPFFESLTMLSPSTLQWFTLFLMPRMLYWHIKPPITHLTNVTFSILSYLMDTQWIQGMIYCITVRALKSLSLIMEMIIAKHVGEGRKWMGTGDTSCVHPHVLSHFGFGSGFVSSLVTGDLPSPVYVWTVWAKLFQIVKLMLTVITPVRLLTWVISPHMMEQSHSGTQVGFAHQANSWYCFTCTQHQHSYCSLFSQQCLRVSIWVIWVSTQWVFRNRSQWSACLSHHWHYCWWGWCIPCS